MAKSAVVKKSQVAEVVFSGINGLPEDQQKFGVTADHIGAFVQEKAGGNPNNVGVRLVATVDPKAEQPLPYEAKNTLYDKDGQPKTTLRGKVVWHNLALQPHCSESPIGIGIPGTDLCDETDRDCLHQSCHCHHKALHTVVLTTLRRPIISKCLIMSGVFAGNT